MEDQILDDKWFYSLQIHFRAVARCIPYASLEPERCVRNWTFCKVGYLSGTHRACGNCLQHCLSPSVLGKTKRHSAKAWISLWFSLWTLPMWRHASSRGWHGSVPPLRHPPDRCSACLQFPTSLLRNVWDSPWKKTKMYILNLTDLNQIALQDGCSSLRAQHQCIKVLYLCYTPVNTQHCLHF